MNLKPFLQNLLAFGLLFLAVTGGVYLIVRTAKIDRMAPFMQQINLEAVGKVQGSPTVATVNIGVVTQGNEISKLAKENTEKMNKMTVAMKELGIPDADLQTQNYSISPQYAYEEKKAPRIQGYQIHQTLVVKIRDLTKVNSVLAKAVESGSNQVSGPLFTIDDEKNLVIEARKKAFQELGEKKKVLEENLNVELGRIFSYNEWVEQPGNGGPIYAEMGGDRGFPVTSPMIQPGSLELILHVNVGYEIE